MIDAHTARRFADYHLKLRTVERNDSWRKYDEAHSRTPSKALTLVVDEERIVECKFGWVFTFVAYSFGDTRGHKEDVLGGILFLVNRNDGSIHQLKGFPWPLEMALADYEAPSYGFDAEWYDLIIHRVHRLPETLDFLHNLYLRCWEPRTTPNFLIPRPYESEEITEMLTMLPCKFSYQAIRHHFRAFLKMNETRDCTYELIGLSGEAARDPNHDFREKLKHKS